MRKSAQSFIKEEQKKIIREAFITGKSRNSFNAAKQRAWLDLCGFEPKYSGAVPAESRAEQGLIALRLALQGWAFRTHGLNCAPVIYTQAATHDSVANAAKTLFWNDDNKRGRPVLRLVPQDKNGAIDAAAFAKMVADDRSRGLVPLIAVGTFGTDKGNATDPLRAMADICHRNEIWFHIDAAKNGRFLAHAPVASKVRAGFAAADSVATPDLLLTKFPSRLERGFGITPQPTADFNRATENYTKTLAKQAAADATHPASKRFITKLGL